MATQILRTYRFALDAKPEQVEVLRRYANASRAAFNFALGTKVPLHEKWQRGRDALVAAGMERKAANKRAPKVPIPRKPQVHKHFIATKGRGLIGPLREGEERRAPFPWWEGVNANSFQEAFFDADTAWKNWKESMTGKRAGPPVGFPKFKRRGRCRESFRLTSNAVRFTDYRHLWIGGGGGQKVFTVRLHEPARKLVRLLGSGQARLMNATVARSGHRWFAAVLVEETVTLPSSPTRKQAAAGRIGVDLGVKMLAAFSDPVILNAGDPALWAMSNPRHVQNTAKKLRRAQRITARRFVKGANPQSKGYEEAKARVAKLHAALTASRSTTQHLLTKRLVEQYAEVALESLAVKGMTASAKGTASNPGKGVRQKAGLNKSILDVGFGEIRRQVEYKAAWYGSTVRYVDRFHPSSKTCSNCGWKMVGQTLRDRVFTCEACGMIMDRDANAARVIKKYAT
ncbi:RNA-guided endonuclease TnpB family protein [Streptomyces physcomitrii]|uniref:RNA-guided endonuclease TnpB family protein n=1 Tax=Streptomyces physcomitrii TaxID=2724184 RepID=UPI0034487C39